MDGKKDGKQKYRVRINYQDIGGAAKQLDRVTYGFEEAKQLEMKLLQDLKQEAPAKKMTIRMLFEEYIDVKKYEVRESSLDKTRRILEFHIMPDMESVKIDKLSTSVLQKWKTSMEEKNLALNTKKNAFGEFRAMLNYAVKMEYISKNPLLKVGNFKTSSELKKDMDYYTQDEFKSFILEARKYAESSPHSSVWYYYVFFNIAFYTGLRKGEIHALKWSDIDDGYLSVKRSICQKVKGGDRETPPKNKSSIRILQLPTPLINILSEHYKRCEGIVGFNDDWRICGGKQPLRDSSIQNMNVKFSELAKIKTIRIHDFRHSHASLLANEGINIQEIARRLGHTKIEMTWNTYAHLYPREEERAIAVLNKIV